MRNVLANTPKQWIRIVLCLLLGGIITPGFTQNIELEYDATSLEEVINQLESRYGLLFSYKEEDIQNISITYRAAGEDLNTFLTNILQNTTLSFEILDDNYVLLTSKKPSTDTPPLPGTIICGTVIDSLTGESLPFASIYLKRGGAGTNSRTDGSFRMRSLLSSSDTLVVSYVGYREKQFLATEYAQRGCPQIALDYLSFGEDFVVVTEYLTDGVQLYSHSSAAVLDMDKIGPLPGQVEADVLQSIQFLPGISAPDGTASGINIRGGTPDQNLILWEDIPIYHSAHYFGMFSAFNPYIINKVAVYRGGFGAEYGGRVSGVIDLRSEPRRDQQAHFGAGLNFINAYTHGDFKAFDRKLSVIYSVRRSITDAWRSPTFNNVSRRIQQGILVQNIDLNRLPPGITIEDRFNFVDANLKVNYRLGLKDEISLATFFANNDFADEIDDDRAMQTQTDTLYLESQGLNLSWKREWRPGLSTKLMGLQTRYRYDYDYQLLRDGMLRPNKSGAKMSEIEERQVHLINSWKSPSQHFFQLGYQFVDYDVRYQITRTDQNNIEGSEINDFESNLQVLYGKYTSPIYQRWGVDAGLRLTRFAADDNFYFEPRLQLWYHLSQAFRAYANAGRYVQFLSQIYEIEGDDASIETPVWALAGSREVPILEAEQYQLGLVFEKDSWLIDVQAYRKNIDGLSSIATGFSEDLAGRFHIGMAQIRGIDLLVKKRWGNYRSWVSYTLSEIDYRFPTFFDSEFLAPIDQRHQLQWVNMWSPGVFEFSLGWRLASGSPHSSLDNFEVRLNQQNMGPREIIFPLENDFNSERLPWQHQLNASASYSFRGERDRWRGQIGLAFMNVYHQRNIFQREFFIRGGNPDVDPFLEYNDKVNLGFTTNLVFRVEW